MMMKIKRCLILPLLVGLLAGCNDWLDIKSDNVLLQEEIFADYTGVRMAVNGVYRDLGVEDLYGKNLSWGFMSAIARNYQLTGLPTEMADGAAFKWKNSSVQGVTEKIWAKAYNVIANCNNIIEQVQTKDTSFFRFGEVEKNLVLGEMRGVRALLHFDLLRLFCPAPATLTDFKVLAIPYVTHYPEHQPERLNMEQVFASIIEDMEYAKKTLAPLDTLQFEGWTKKREHRFYNSVRTGSWDDDFLNFRGERMNYWGATALLARVYMWKGDLENAYKNASDIYRFHTNGWFKWTGAAFQGSLVDYPEITDTKRWEELLLGFYNSQNLTTFEALLSNNANRFRMNEMEKLFKEDTDDYRYRGFYNRYGDYRYSVWLRPKSQSTAYATYMDAAIKYQGPILPIVRFTEMYYIMIEYLIEKDRIPEAKALLGTLRNQRGVKDPTLPDDPGLLMDKLVNDMIREGLTEGQTFFMYKRLVRNIFNGDRDIIMEKGDYTPEYPNNEVAYSM